MSTRAPMQRGRGKDEASRAMDLPEGKTCSDCRHVKRCCAIFGHIPEDEVCDWFPSRFVPTEPLPIEPNQGEK